MAKKKIKLGLIGCGANMTQAHVPRIKADGAVDIVGVADPAGPAAERLMERWGGELPYYADWRQLFRNGALDAVFISTPHRDHYLQARRALEAGLHVLIEKPLVIAPRHAKALIDLAGRKRRLLVVAYQRHWMAPYVYARELVRTRKLGRVRGVVGYVTQRWGGLGGWRLDPELAGGGMFMDTGSHLVASMLWVTGLEPRLVAATMDNAGQRVDINAVLQLSFANGALGTLNTFGNAGRHDERLAITGSDGSLVIRLHQWRVKSLLVNDEPAKIPARIKSASPDRAFFGWIRNGGKGYEKPAFALQVSRLSEAAYRSAERGAPVRVRS
ncbi:MAG: Gfo/Idh/MocA family oxidoreductase [Myxococcota bacterium]